MMAFEHQPGKQYGHHSNDTPYIYDPEKNVLYHGDHGAFHSDVEKHPDLAETDPETGWNRANNGQMIRGRYGPQGVQHYEPWGAYAGDDAAEHQEAVEQALGLPNYEYGDDMWLDAEREDAGGMTGFDLSIPLPGKTAKRDFAHWWDAEKPHRKYNASKMA